MNRWLILLLCLCCLSGYSQLTYDQVFIDYDSAVEFKNLKIIPVRPKKTGTPPKEISNTVSLSEAMARGLVSVVERGSSSVENVHWLSLYNNSDKNIFIASGEILAGGRQDRMVTKDTLVLARAGRIDLPVMCVEEERWSEKDKKFTYQKMANPHLRKVLDISKNQVLIWNEIHDQLTKDTVKNKTLSYLARGLDKKFAPRLQEYFSFFQQKFREADSNIVGIVCVSGDKVIGSDIFAGSNLFYGQLNALLQGYIEEAMVYGSKPALNDAGVKKYLDQFLKDEISQAEFVKKNGKIFKVSGKVIHLTTY